MQLRHLCLMMTATGFAACGSDEVIYPELELAPVSSAALDSASGEPLALHLKNGMRLQLREFSRPPGGWGFGGGFGGSAPPEPTPAPTPTPGGFSGTNVHVAGIDEADTAKYDGEHWYIALRPGEQDYQLHSHAQIQVAQLDPALPGAELIGDLTFEDELSIDEMYLVGDSSERRLAVMRADAGNVPPRPPAWGGSFAFTRSYPDNGRLQIALVDVSEPSAPALNESITIDGSLIDSRRIGDTLYLVTRFDPWLAALTYDSGQASQREANEAALAEAPLESLLPSVIDASGERLLTESCLLPADRESHHGFAPMVFVSTVNLASGHLESSVCVSGPVSSLSMFSDSLYLTGATPAGNTVLHRFAVSEEGVAYAATGEVAGSIINGRSDPAFRLDERDGYLRVVSSRRDGAQLPNSPPVAVGEIVHQLTVLEQQAERLVAVAMLPNESRPDRIGKPREDIYSVRFEEDTAYLVTFQRTDPLYAIDLTDPLDPRIAGELEIPGYASYMHPLAGDYLFTLGMNANDFGQVQGMKFELVKVEAGEPRVVDQVLLPLAFGSEALDNLRALSVLEVSEQQYRFVLPVRQRSDGDDFYYHADNALQLLEVDLASETLHNRGQLRGSSGAGDGSVQRGLLQDDAVFYASGRSVLAAPFGDPAAVTEARDLREQPVCDQAELGESFILTARLSDADFASCPTLDIPHRFGTTQQQLAVEGELVEGDCVYTGPRGQYGMFTANIEYPGYYGVSVPMPVYREACTIHSVQDQVTLTPLPQPVPCTADVRPSIVVEVSLAGEGDACDAQVTASNLESAALHTLTSRPTDGGNCLFEGPYEQEGRFHVTVALEGYTSHTQSVRVVSDVCHVQTQTLPVELQPTPTED